MKTYDMNIINQLVTDGKLMKQTHPKYPLSIYKYTVDTQFGKLWDEVTLRCRGLVLDEQGNAYSNPIPKFFNIEELQPDQIPNLPYEISDKVDGSCIEVFYYNGRMIVCTLGSFMSDQAILAESMLKGQYCNLLRNFIMGQTYIFELVAPENRIVLDYGAERKLVLITVRDNETDEESLPDIGFPLVDIYDKSIEELLIEKKRPDFTNKEGCVILFENGYRIKVKYEEYFRLHKLMTGVNEKFVWEFLKEGKPLPLENVPDEFFQYVTGVKTDLETQYYAIERKAQKAFIEVNNPNFTRKQFALMALSEYSDVASLLFKMLENKAYDQLIWKMVEPKSTGAPKFNSFRGNDETA
jgi:RNA ligase